MSGRLFLPDQEALSPGGQYRLEARAPHNGSVPAQTEPYRMPYFRFQLWDQRTRECLWERWQPDFESSPTELLVSDQGFSLFRLHSPMFPPRLLAFDVAGKLLVDVLIGPAEPPKNWDGIIWNAEELCHTTAGTYWTGSSWRYFCQHNHRSYFVWRTRRGQRLIILLSAEPAQILEADGDLEAVFQAHETSQALTFFQCYTRGHRHDLPGALVLLLAHLPRECLLFVRKLEARKMVAHYGSSRTIGPGVRLGIGYRPFTQQIQRRLDVEPLGYPAYEFLREGRPLTGIVPHRQARLAQLCPLLTPLEVLELAGSPDHLFNDFDTTVETWEYDCRRETGWTTLALTWDTTTQPASLRSIEERKPDWDSRELRMHPYPF